MIINIKAKIKGSHCPYCSSKVKNVLFCSVLLCSVPGPQEAQVREGESEQGEAGCDVVRLNIRTHIRCSLL